MKNLFFILLIILIASCTNDSETISEKSEFQSQNKFSTDIAKQQTEDALTLISAFTGRALLKHRDARLEIQNYLNLNTNVINVQQILGTKNAFKDAFKYEYDLIVHHDRVFNSDPNTHGLGNFHPPIDIGDNSGLRQTIAIEVIDNILNGTDSNCFELFFPKPFVLGNLTDNEEITNEDLFTSKHPLEDVYPSGYKLWQNITPDQEGDYEDGEDLLFDDYLFLNQNTNIIIARPFRNQDCAYSLFSSVNFEDFYD